MKTKLLSSIAGLAMVAGGLTGFGAGTAFAGGSVPLPMPDNSAGLFVPPNCEYVQDKTGISSLECELPPECEVVTIDNGGPLQVSYVECDIDAACELAYGSFLGTTYWYIDCDESECIGGCDPVTPPDLGLKQKEKPRTTVIWDTGKD